MFSLQVDKAVLKELGDPKRYPAKIYRQIALKMFSLQFNPHPPDSKKIGQDRYRVDSGEYRILYKIDEREKVVKVFLVGKRGDDEIYRRLRRRL